jgi:hypothetical protein
MRVLPHTPADPRRAAPHGAASRVALVVHTIAPPLHAAQKPNFRSARCRAVTVPRTCRIQTSDKPRAELKGQLANVTLRLVSSPVPRRGREVAPS